jgi:hypothetical protein
MILAAALALVPVSAAAVPLAQPESEIVVLGRLRTIGVNVGRNRAGEWTCGLDRSTGRATLDERLCRAVTKCVRKGAETQTEVEICIRTSRAQLVRQVEQVMKKEGSE